MLWHISFLYVHVLWSPPKQMVLTTRDMYLYICVLICWAGFPELNQDDQLILIKCGFFEVWLMRMARMFNKAEGCLTFEDGSIIQKEELGVVFSVSLRSQENHWCLCCSNFFWKICLHFAVILCSYGRRLRADWFLVCHAIYFFFCLQYKLSNIFWNVQNLNRISVCTSQDQK